jgi:hypothetical protein
MKHPLVRFVLAVIVVLLVIILLKAVSLTPNQVLIRDGHWHIDIGFTKIELGSDRDSWFNPLLLVHVLTVPAAWHLCRRAGYSSWFSLAMLIPLANVLLLYFLAFAEWPTQTRDDRPIGSSRGGAGLTEEKPPPNWPSDDIRV